MKPKFHTFRILRHAMALAALAVLTISHLSSQPYWARTAVGVGSNEALAVTGDADGNIYATGYFTMEANVHGTDLVSYGQNDIFIARQNADGSNEWVVQAGGSGLDRGLGITTDSDGNVVVCGFYSGTADFGNGVTLTASGTSQDAFVAKYDAGGNALWARSGGNANGNDRANAVATDADGNVIIAGQYIGQVAFGPFNLPASGGSNNVFIVKYNAQGEALWARSGTGGQQHRAFGVTTDQEGGVYACGQFSGNITFQTPFENTLFGAVFLIKFDGSGSQQWMRFGGSPFQSAANGVTSNGTEVFLTGETGQTFTWVNSPGQPTIDTGANFATFVAGFAANGNYLWGDGKGSASPVASRGIAHRDGALAIAGSYECTFADVSAEYGPATFNSIGFSDAVVMRYDTDGNFDRARNFGSQQPERATGIFIAPDGQDVVSGTFQTHMVIPIRDAVSGDGMAVIDDSPNPGLTYCGDNAYGEFSRIEGVSGNDGFVMKAIDPERAPYDFYHRQSAGICNLAVPSSCISAGNALGGDFACTTTLNGCPGQEIIASNFTGFGDSDISPALNVSWSTGGLLATTIASTDGVYTATLTSVDGCYTSNATVTVNLDDAPAPPILTDSEGVNTGSPTTQPVTICPGTSVTLNSPGAGTWSGPGVTPDMEGQASIEVSEEGIYLYTIDFAVGCPAVNAIAVAVEPALPTPMQPFLNFNLDSDTLEICEFVGLQALVQDSLAPGALIPANQFSWNWSMAPQGSVTGFNVGNLFFTAEGWHYITLTMTSNLTDCPGPGSQYVLNDSVYVFINDNPVLDLEVEGPAEICEGDSVWFQVLTNATSFTTTPNTLLVQGDSILITGPGNYAVQANLINSAGCTASNNLSFEVAVATPPTVTTATSPALLCPGEGAELSTDAEGAFAWMGPDGPLGSEPTIFVEETGNYFVQIALYGGCTVESDTVQVFAYTTPTLGPASGVICPDSELVITVESPVGGEVTWLEPLSGSGMSQVVTEPGTYQAEVEACGIVTLATLEVVLSTGFLDIDAAIPSPLCSGDSVGVVATGGHFDYAWEGAVGDDSLALVFETGTVQATAVDSFGCALESNAIDFEFEPAPPAAEAEFAQPCAGESLTILVESGFEVNWLENADGSVLFVGNSLVIASVPSDTTLFVQLNDGTCRGPVTTVEVSPLPSPEEPILFAETPVCTGRAFELAVLNADDDVDYLWIGPEGPVANTAAFTLFAESTTQSGTYTVQASLEGCSAQPVGVEVTVVQTRSVVLPPDGTVCIESSFVLEADTTYAAYLWQDGSVEPTFEPEASGVFTLEVVDFNGCSSAAAVELDLVECTVEIPNVFTPNGDGRNDTWLLDIADPLRFDLVVFDRWGKEVFGAAAVTQAWDGTHKANGQACAEGVYFYVVQFTLPDGEQRTETGQVTLLRDAR